MVKQKIVIKLKLDGEKQKRKAFKTAVGVTGVTSATMEADKISVVGEDVDAVKLTRELRRNVGKADLVNIAPVGGPGVGGGGGMGMGFGHGGGGGGGGMGFGGGKDGGKVDGGLNPQLMAPPMPNAGYPQYNPAVPYPGYPGYPGYPQQDLDGACSIM